MASGGVHPPDPATGSLLETAFDIGRSRQPYNHRLYVGILREQYPVTLLTSPYLPRPSTIGFVGVLPSEAHLPEAPQQRDVLVRIDSVGQANDDQVHRGGSERGHYGPQHQSRMEGIGVIAYQHL
jgi:hypothetical protein